MNERDVPRREALRRMITLAAGAGVCLPLLGCRDESASSDEATPAAEMSSSATGPTTVPAESTRVQDPVASAERLQSWVATLRDEGLGSRDVPFGEAAIRVGELAIGTPYVPSTLEEYIRSGGDPARSEPLTVDLTRFDCVTLVESCIGVARVARSPGAPTWGAFAHQIERMRYRDGKRTNYASRLHYFSEWLYDNERRGLVRRLGEELGGVPDRRPLRFMTNHVDSYAALADPEVLAAIAAMERSLDGRTRWVVPTARIPQIVDRLMTGDILAFATAIEGLDVTHAAFAYLGDDGAMRVLHAPLSGGVVEIKDETVEEYVAAIRQSTGILVARALDG